MPVEYGEPLSERELEIVALVAEGLTNREIATRMFLSPNTVKVHLRNIFTKTGAASRTELTVQAMQAGWIAVPGVMAEVSEAPSLPAGETGAALPRTDVPIVLPVSPVVMPPPPWPLQRWLALAVAALLAAGVLWLPARAPGQAGVTGPETIFSPTQPSAETPLPAGEEGWEELPALPMRRAGLGLAATRGQLYAAGGMTEAGVTAQLDVYDIASGAWQMAAPRPAALANFGLIARGDALLAPGGCDADWQPTTAVHRYAVTQDAWEMGAPLPEPLCAYALTVTGDRAYLFGGIGAGKVYRAVAYTYDFANEGWEELPPPSTARAFGAAAALSDRVFYVGGHDGKQELNMCEVYLPAERRWQSCAPLLQPRSGLGLVALGNRLQAVGGGWETYLGFNERYDAARDQWTAFATPMVGEWRNLGLAAWDGALYAVGGWNGDYMNRTYRLEVLQFRTFIPITFSGNQP